MIQWEFYQGTELWFLLLYELSILVSEEQCLAEIEEEWNDLVARHHALIGKTPEKYATKTTSHVFCLDSHLQSF